MKLTESLILQATKVDNIAAVKHLNMWGRQISDISVLRNMPNLEVLSLSVNKITTLRDLVHCPKLKELYLRKNEVADISEILFLKPLANLKVLWLSENPCSFCSTYRLRVIATLKHLDKLDDAMITMEEKKAANNSELEMQNSDLGNPQIGQKASYPSDPSPSYAQHHQQQQPQQMIQRHQENKEMKHYQYPQQQQQMYDGKKPSQNPYQVPQFHPPDYHEHGHRQQQPFHQQNAPYIPKQQEDEAEVEIRRRLPSNEAEEKNDVRMEDKQFNHHIYKQEQEQNKPAIYKNEEEDEKSKEPISNRHPGPKAAFVLPEVNYIDPVNRNNILLAVLSLIKELDNERLHIVKKEIEKLL